MKSHNTVYNSALRFGLAAASILFLVSGAVGIIGYENYDANMMYLGVLYIAVFGSIVARFQPQGMARAMFATTATQTFCWSNDT